jgi:Domain of unknown function (DUF4382)
MKYRLPAALMGSLAAVSGLLAGCSARTEVSLSGNTPSQYSHVYITAQAVWFNTSATAGPDDSGWQQFSLSTPTTVDLVADQDGSLGTLATDLKLIAGTYSQIRLIPVDSSATLTASAQAAGALYNAEADYVDGSGTTHQLPLELLNPDKGIGMQSSLKVPIGNLGSTGTTGVLGVGTGTTTTGTTTTGTTTTGTTTTGTTTTGTTTTGTTTGTTTATGSSTTTIASFTVNIDGGRDLVPFTYAATPASSGILLSSHASAYDLAQVGGISGTLTLTNLTNYSAQSGLPDIQASAETLSADGTRHEVLLSTAVHSDGTFLLYPLPTSTSTPAYYDVVIHGGGIATIIIKNVQLTLGTTTTALTAASIPSSATNTDTSTVTAPSLSTVSIGTLIPRVATTYTANVTTVAANPLPAGALVAFYQTLGASGEVPYVIESAPLDPFNQVLFNPQVLSAGTVDSGTYVASDETVTVVSAAPVQGAGKYVVAGTAPNYADGVLTPLVAPPSSGTNPVTVTVPGLSFAAGASTGSVVAVITPSTPGKYNQGQLLVSHEGALVASAALDSVLAQGGSVSAIVPVGTPSSYYYVSVRVWNSRSPSGTLSRQWYPSVIDLRSSTSGSIPLTIN